MKDLLPENNKQKHLSAASKKRVIKNRNDPKFWGLKIKEKVLCGDCLEKRKGTMKPLRRAKFNEYRRLGGCKLNHYN